MHLATPERGSLKGRLILVLAGLWLLAALPFLTDVACNAFVALALLGTWPLAALAWVVVGLLGAWTETAWRLAAIALVLGVVLAFSDIGLVIRVRLSQPWLDAYARQVPRGASETDHDPRWVGLFRVDGTENRRGAVFLYTSQSFLNRHGLAIIPPELDGRPFARTSARPLLGAWSTFEWRF